MVTDWLKLENRLKATPLDLLKQGVTNRQWEAVDAAYTMLTGLPVFRQATLLEVAELPVATAADKLQAGSIQELQEAAQQLQESDKKELKASSPANSEAEAEPDLEEEEASTVRKDKRVRIKARRSKINRDKQEPNKFVDDPALASEDIKFMPKEGTPRTHRLAKRPPFTQVKVVCKGCGKREKVDPELVPRKIDRNYRPRYLCNECACGPKGGGIEE